MDKTKNTLVPITKKDKSFANGYNYYKLFWIFLIGSIAGVVIETLWCLVTTHHIESRTALVIGPFNPVYGFGAILMTFIYIMLKNKNNFYIFFVCMILGGLFESFCSLFQETVFGTVSWYYDADSLGILGKRTSIIYCIFWGILGIVWIKAIFPNLTNLIEKIPNKTGIILTWILTFFLIFDMLLSTAAVYRQRQRRNHVEADSKINVFLDEKYNDDVLKEIYPNMTVIK